MRFAAYADDRRRQALELLHREDLGHLVRYTPKTRGAEGLVVFARLDPSTAQQQIAAQIAHFAALGTDFEWKLYDFDAPADLRELLIRQGFLPGEPEVFMLYALDKPVPLRAAATPWQIRRVSDERGVLDVVAVQERIWGRTFDWLPAQLLHSLRRDPDGISIYCAYVDGKPVGTGWTDFPPGSDYPELHGGAVLKDWRGQGIYSELYRLRLAEAAQRNCRQVAVDASAMSRPILEKLGFEYVCNTVPMRFKIEARS
jgi:GNAT superfamily N-acetyltransferase